MSSLTNKRILLGITGGIAAYKAAELVRLLIKRGAQVQVIMTAGAEAFITPLTLQALSGNPVHTDLLNPKAEAGMGHIELARWADAFIVAPASADFLARLVQGLGNDLLTTVCLASKAPLAVAPAMNQQMWVNSATKHNISVLLERGIAIWGPAIGEQACGDNGLGRMLDAADIVPCAEALFESGLLSGKTVVITAGATLEALDPVRYLSNRSSGKMGYALAQAALDAGAKVILISGSTALTPPQKVSYVGVESAEQMLAACLTYLGRMDVFIAAAAVADYRPRKQADQKIKKQQEETMVLELVKNPDIVATISAQKSRPFVVGFAAETERMREYAQSKLVNKGLDMVVANDVSNDRIGFNSDNNAAEIITKNSIKTLSERSKYLLAKEVIKLVATDPKFLDSVKKLGADR